jgi:hypothetical protein
MIKIVYNTVGMACLAIGVVAGLIASAAVRPSIAFAIGAGVMGLADFAYRWKNDEFTEGGGMIWYVPSWILGFAFCGVSTLFIIMSATGMFDYKH